jgi:hypothetical protein
MEAAQEGVRTVKRLVRNTGEFVENLTLQQAAMVGAVLVGGALLVNHLFLMFYSKFMPGYFVGFAKLQAIIMLPAVAIAGAAFGMWMEHKFSKFAELKQQVEDKIAEVRESRSKYD